MIVTSIEMDIQSIRKEAGREFDCIPTSYLSATTRLEEEQWNKTVSVFDKLEMKTKRL